MSVSTDSTVPPSTVAPDGDAAKRRPRRKRFGLPVWLLLCLTLASVLFIALTLLLTGWVEGEEFSPRLCQTRRFSYFEVPILQLQVTPITRKSTTPEAARFLTQASWWQTKPPGTSGLKNSPPAKSPVAGPTWHLVSVTHGARNAQFDDAALLVQQLRRRDNSGSPYWKNWTKEHPELGKVLWPVIIRLANRELYLMMPPLFECAAASQAADRLQASIDASLRLQYRNVIADTRAAGQEELASELAREASADFPQDALLSQLADELSAAVASHE